MKKIVTYIIVLLVSAHCFAQSDEFIRNINVEGELVVVNGDGKSH